MRIQQRANTTANETGGCEHNKSSVEQNSEHRTAFFEQRTALETSPDLIHMQLAYRETRNEGFSSQLQLVASRAGYLMPVSERAMA